MGRRFWIMAFGLGCKGGVVLDQDKDNTEDSMTPQKESPRASLRENKALNLPVSLRGNPQGNPLVSPRGNPAMNPLKSRIPMTSMMMAMDLVKIQDCDDTDASVSPSAQDIPNDGIDQNYDDDLVDADLDGFSAQDDCDDSDASVYPGASEVADDGVDQDCNGVDLSDSDGDGVFNDVDCDDANGTVYPGATERCDGLFNDCNSQVWSATIPPLPEQDFQMAMALWQIIIDPAGWAGDPAVVGGEDCDDSSASVYPGAQEQGSIRSTKTVMDLTSWMMMVMAGFSERMR